MPAVGISFRVIPGSLGMSEPESANSAVALKSPRYNASLHCYVQKGLKTGVTKNQIYFVWEIFLEQKLIHLFYEGRLRKRHAEIFLQLLAKQITRVKHRSFSFY
ncbi:hypothetical protein ILYODFUR_027705 [Ilyodon furcidens]|uniref:Uncharacterized protein n=1 Tax=Ilyodon furcidens TaxID=33524 RepID=A0ABV0UAX6_9TELE